MMKQMVYAMVFSIVHEKSRKSIIIVLLNRLPIFVNHSDSVWCLYNNYDAPFNQQSLLFSSGADGPLLCYDVERGLLLLLCLYL